jgi:hypothetical protein
VAVAGELGLLVDIDFLLFIVGAFIRRRFKPTPSDIEAFLLNPFYFLPNSLVPLVAGRVVGLRLFILFLVVSIAVYLI